MAINANSVAGVISARPQRHPVVDGVLRIYRNPVGAVFGTVILFLIFCALAAPVIAPYDPVATSRATFLPPSFAYPFGTDNLGRDQLSRVLYGSRISLYVGFVSVAIGTAGGTLVGLVSAFFGGLFDLIVQRFVDGMLALPGLVLAIALVSVLGASTTNALIAISIGIIPGSSRVIRSAALQVKQEPFVEAARALGAAPSRIMVLHILPNVLAPILILVSASVGGAILTEAGLSFLGVGTQPPNPSWGLMLSTTGRQYIELAPWLAIFPGLAISITVLAFNMFGDAVRDVFDPRLRGSR